MYTVSSGRAGITQNPCPDTPSQVHDLPSVLVQGVWAATGRKGEGFKRMARFLALSVMTVMHRHRAKPCVYIVSLNLQQPHRVGDKTAYFTDDNTGA